MKRPEGLDFPESPGGHPVTATSHDVLSGDKTLSAPGEVVRVACNWLSREPQYFVSLALSYASEDDDKLVPLTPMWSVGEMAKGNLLVTRDSEMIRLRPPERNLCEYTLLSIDFESLWISVLCPVVENDGNGGCQISEGYLYFENCRDAE